MPDSNPNSSQSGPERKQAKNGQRKMLILRGGKYNRKKKRYPRCLWTVPLFRGCKGHLYPWTNGQLCPCSGMSLVGAYSGTRGRNLIRSCRKSRLESFCSHLSSNQFPDRDVCCYLHRGTHPHSGKSNCWGLLAGGQSRERAKLLCLVAHRVRKIQDFKHASTHRSFRPAPYLEM